MPPRLLIAGIGNIFLGDDAFGVAVAQRLLVRLLPPRVTVRDFGIRGFDLAYALLDGYDGAILVDAVNRGEPPGTLYVIEPEVAAFPNAEDVIQTHSMDPVKVLRLFQTMGGSLPWIRLIGCEPASLEGELSGPVQAAVPEAIKLIESLMAEFFGARQVGNA